MSEMYTKHASEYSEAVKTNICNSCFERPSTISLLDDVKDKNVIDMGCGPGVYAEWFIQRSVNQLTCIDASYEMIELVKNKFPDSVKAYVQDLSLGLPQEKSNSADVIVCPLVIHYIKDLSLIFADVFRILKVGGYLVFSTHHPFADFECSNTGNYFERELVKEEWDTIGKPVEVSFYRRSLTEVCNAITSSGLVITKISEGVVNERAKNISENTYNHLKNKPNFIFFRCEKIHT